MGENGIFVYFFLFFAVMYWRYSSFVILIVKTTSSGFLPIFFELEVVSLVLFGVFLFGVTVLALFKPAPLEGEVEGGGGSGGLAGVGTACFLLFNKGSAF